MASRPFRFWEESGHKFGTICPEVRRGARNGAFIYALSADETNPLFPASQPQTKPCFPTASNVLAFPGGNLIFAATPTERITHYTLQAKSCAKWGAAPFGNPTRKGDTPSLRGTYRLFLFSSPPAVSIEQKASGVVVWYL